MPGIHLRPALPDDIPEMIKVMQLAFRDSILNQRSFPESDPQVQQHYTTWITNNLKDPASLLIIASEEENEEDRTGTDPNPLHPIAGWARWVRRPIPLSTASSRPSPAKVFTPGMYPKNGDGQFAARYYQANYDATQRIVGSRSHWFLSMLVVHPGLQRRGVGSTLMKFGTDRAGEEGWPVYVNSSVEGKAFYESFRCRIVDESELEGMVVGYHMLRDAA
ncbi:hypothetical protein PT974_04129 [Cladobotryum mycophilum]|uniref:N-acetyltransferase domain-containing protein n=1 Tax=Cladobotryum mycophilum TaxID=491253 RepID=A0ABR0SU75_9HYPO